MTRAQMPLVQRGYRLTGNKGDVVTLWHYDCPIERADSRTAALCKAYAAAFGDLNVSFGVAPGPRLTVCGAPVRAQTLSWERLRPGDWLLFPHAAGNGREALAPLAWGLVCEHDVTLMPMGGFRAHERSVDRASGPLWVLRPYQVGGRP